MKSPSSREELIAAAPFTTLPTDLAMRIGELVGNPAALINFNGIELANLSLEVKRCVEMSWQRALTENQPAVPNSN